MPEKGEKLAEFVESCVSELAGHTPTRDSHLGQASAFVFEHFQPRTVDLLKPEQAATFYNCKPFVEFVDFAMSDEQLVESVFGQNFDLGCPSDRHLFRRMMEMYLLRGLVAIHYSPTMRAERMAGFLNFLELDRVERTIVAPLEHVGLNCESYDLGEFGVLRAEGTQPSDRDEREVSVPNRCVLTFVVKTKKYFGAFEFPLMEQLRSRIDSIRMAAAPFVSLNRFSISHVHPWEEPLRDELFCDRFYGRALKLIISSQEDIVRISRALLEEVRTLYDGCRTDKWKVSSPWRLALNRLDDAVFKIKTGSPDALLDVVIGLESVLVEADSAQESTHKVAVRAARLMEQDAQRRLELFRSVKRLYALRSKIAHGKSLAVDEPMKRLLNDGVGLLTAILKTMLERDLVELDLPPVDLGL